MASLSTIYTVLYVYTHESQMAAVFEVRGESNQYGYLRKKQIKMNTYTHTHNNKSGNVWILGRCG